MPSKIAPLLASNASFFGICTDASKMLKAIPYARYIVTFSFVFLTMFDAPVTSDGHDRPRASKHHETE